MIPSIGVGISDLNNLLSNDDVDLDDDNILNSLNEASFGNEWYDRTFPNINFNGTSSSNTHIRKNSLLVGDLKDWGNLEYNSEDIIDQPSNNIFENDVDLSMYEHVAANLQKTNPSKLNKVSGYLSICLYHVMLCYYTLNYFCHHIITHQLIAYKYILVVYIY